MIVSTPSISGVFFNKLTIANFLNIQSDDLKLSYKLKFDYTSVNISELSNSQIEFLEYRKSWSKYFLSDSLLVISEYELNDSSHQIGIDFTENSINQKRSNLTFNQIEYFNNNISLENFHVNSELPFELSIIFSYSYLQSLNLTTFRLLSSESFIGQVIDFNIKKISSPESYLRLITNLVDEFEAYLMSINLIEDSSFEEGFNQIEVILTYKNSFDSLVILVSLVTLIISVWLSEFFTDNFLTQVKGKINKLHERGLEFKRRKIISVYIPLMLELACFFVISVILLIANVTISLDFLLTALILGFFSIILFYKSYRKFNNSDKFNINSKTIVLFVLILLIVSLIPILLKQLTYAIIPDKIFSYFTLFSQTIQYFIITLLITEIYIKKISTNLFKKFGIRNLVNKLINKKENIFRQLIHSTLLLVWGTTIVMGGFQTFSVNYNLNFEMEYPTDLVISTDVYLYNISSLQNNNFSQILAVSHTQESFFITYDLYLMNFSAIKEIIPYFEKYFDLSNLEEGITYMSKDFAKEFDFVEGDYFPTKIGENGTSVYVDQEIRIVDYFPFIKKVDDQPFIVTSYNEQYNNISKVSKLYLNLENNLSKIEAINYLEEQLETSVQEIKEAHYMDYTIFILIFQLYFILITIITIRLCLKQLLVAILKPMRILSQRGMSSKFIKKRLFINLSFSLLISVLLGVSLGIFYLMLQLPTAVYTTPQYIPIQIKFWYSLLLIPLMPFLYGFTVMIQKYH
ncbi:MAG: hypothetical protein HZR80_12620 [Candidatus Heimdallarchaeota archaeon]